jgi:hypothetical protein
LSQSPPPTVAQAHHNHPVRWLFQGLGAGTREVVWAHRRWPTQLSVKTHMRTMKPTNDPDSTSPIPFVLTQVCGRSQAGLATPCGRGHGQALSSLPAYFEDLQYSRPKAMTPNHPVLCLPPRSLKVTGSNCPFGCFPLFP